MLCKFFYEVSAIEFCLVSRTICSLYQSRSMNSTNCNIKIIVLIEQYTFPQFCITHNNQIKLPFQHTKLRNLSSQLLIHSLCFHSLFCILVSFTIRKFAVIVRSRIHASKRIFGVFDWGVRCALHFLRCHDIGLPHPNPDYRSSFLMC